VRIAGHPLHPMLVHFPIAAWIGTVVLDVSSRIWTLPGLSAAGFGCLTAGVVLGAVTMLAGFLDYAAIPDQHSAQKTALSHMLVMVVSWLLFTASLTARAFAPRTAPSLWAIGTDMSACIVMIFGARLGGTLVYSFGIGVRNV